MTAFAGSAAGSRAGIVGVPEIGLKLGLGMERRWYGPGRTAHGAWESRICGT